MLVDRVRFSCIRAVTQVWRLLGTGPGAGVACNVAVMDDVDGPAKAPALRTEM